jgi:hypothetical protein
MNVENVYMHDRILRNVIPGGRPKIFPGSSRDEGYAREQAQTLFDAPLCISEGLQVVESGMVGGTHNLEDFVEDASLGVGLVG